MENLHKSKDEIIRDKLFQILQNRENDIESPDPYSTFDQNFRTQTGTRGLTSDNRSGM